MPRFFFPLPNVDPEVDVRLDTDADDPTPALVYGMSGGSPIPGAKLNAGPDGALPRVTTTDGTATLFVKTLDYKGTQIGEPVEVAGVNEDATPDTPNAPSVAVYNIGTGSLATADLADGNYCEMTANPFAGVGDATAGWDLTDPTKLLPPLPGVYAVSVRVYADGTLDEPVEVAVTNGVTGPNVVVGLPVGGYVAAASGLVIINDETVEGVRVQGSYSDVPPTTGGVNVTVWVHRVGEVPA